MALRRPDPREIRQHLALAGAFADGAAFIAATDIAEIRPIAGDVRWRLRFKANQAGTLKARYLRPDGETEYTANNPGDVAIVANVENKIEDATYAGEAVVKFIFTPTGNGVVTLADLSHL